MPADVTSRKLAVAVMADDLASGFQSVDAASDFEVFANCLTLIDSLPFFAECKRESYDLLGASPGSRLLEVGCGLGDDAATLAKRVAPGGSVVAVDGSQAMVDAARERHGDIAGLSFENADATQLPYEDASFRRLSDRPGSAAHRRSRSGDPRDGPGASSRWRAGRVRQRLGDTDDRLHGSGADTRDSQRVVRSLSVGLDRPPAGAAVPRRRARRRRDASRRLWCSSDLGVADRVFSFFATAEGLVHAGTISRADADRWIGELRAADTDGRFFTSYTGFLVSGNRPV